MVSKLKNLVESKNFIKVIITLIIINSIVLGMKSYPYLMERYGYILDVVDDVFIIIFVCELLFYLYVFGIRKCFSDPWYIFDFTVISIVVLPAVLSMLSYFFELRDMPDLGHFSILRAVRVLRVLRLVTTFPTLRKVVQALIASIPGIGSIGALLLIVFYVFALMGINLFGAEFPIYFGTLQDSLFTLFQIMTAESWASAIARPVMETNPYAWVYFVMFIMSTSFVVLNLFIAVIVNVMQKDVDQDSEGDKESMNEIKAMLRDIQKKLK